MKKNIFTELVLVVMLTFLCLGCGSEQTSDPKIGANKKICLIVMDGKSVFQQEINAGCEEAAKEFVGLEYKFFPPEKRELEHQIKCINKAIEEDFDAILISAISITDINETLKRASDAGIKIIYVDSAANFDNVATLMTDNESAGRIAGQTMLKVLKESGITSGNIEVVMSEFSTLNTALRDKGFRSVFNGTSFNILPTFYMGADEQLLKNEVANHPDYVGFFAANQKATTTIGKQLKESGSKQIVVGFDTADETLDMIRDGVIYATIKQNARKMGHDGIEIALKAMNGTFKEKNVVIDTGVTVITEKNLSEAKK